MTATRSPIEVVAAFPLEHAVHLATDTSAAVNIMVGHAPSDHAASTPSQNDGLVPGSAGAGIGSDPQRLRFGNEPEPQVPVSLQRTFPFQCIRVWYRRAHVVLTFA